MLMQIDWIQESHLVPPGQPPSHWAAGTRSVCLLLSPSFPIQNKQIFKGFNSSKHLRSIFRNYPAFNGFTVLFPVFQLVLTVMLLSIIVYIYTVIAFNFFRKFYIKEEDGEVDYKCHDMLTVSSGSLVYNFIDKFFNITQPWCLFFENVKHKWGILFLRLLPAMKLAMS